MPHPSLPDRILFSENIYQFQPGTRTGEEWSHQGTSVRCSGEGEALIVEVQAEDVASPRIALRWDFPLPEDALFLGDHWERGYGDLAWRSFVPERVMPWYFLFTGAEGTTGWGVRTGAGAFCFWTADPNGITLWLDLRSGTGPVRLGGRTLRAAEVVAGTWAERPFVASRAFCRKLCSAPRLAPMPIYGGNDWYYSYSTSTHDTILRDSATLSDLAGAESNRPFSVIDDNWQFHMCANSTPWDKPHPHFPDMTRLAREIRDLGCRPGLWIRPLLVHKPVPKTWTLPARPGQPAEGVMLDPSVPEVLEQVRSDLRTMVSWGYELVKHDFTTFDMFNRWGFEMGASVTEGTWKFQDDSRTSAEIVTGLYRAIREGAGEALLLGCNTVGHLGAGLFEVQRTGDDTSGRDWERTRKMGINTLAFRMGQHDTFFAADADCIGLTQRIPWEWNRQWLELVAASGTALFVSAAPEALGPEQRAALREAFARAARVQESAEPLDWETNTCPQRWLIDGKEIAFDWGDASAFIMA